jgi:hypothetical protein
MTRLQTPVFRILFFATVTVSALAQQAAEPRSPRLEIYKDNPSYFCDPGQGRPVFLSGQVVWTSICTPKLWYSHSPKAFAERYNNREDPALDPDRVIEYLAAKGGNCCRLTTSYGHPLEGQTVGPRFVPWAETAKTISGKAQYDLYKFDATYWERFRHFLGKLEENRIQVLLEVFPNLWQWQNQPIHPTNNINYTEQEVPDGFAWYATVRGGSQKVLRVQEAFVEKVVTESLPFRNVLYLVNNQYLGDPGGPKANLEKYRDREQTLAWPKYWAAFIKQIGAARGEKLLVSTMPAFHAADSKSGERFRWYVDEELFDFVDAGWWQLHPSYEEYGLTETRWMEELDNLPLRDRVRCFADSLRSWYKYQASQERRKPMILSKSLFWDGVQRHSPWPLWIGFVSGCGAASPHEPMSRSYWHAPRYEPTADVVGHLLRFIRESRIEPWKMAPMTGIVFGNGQDAYVLGKEGDTYVVYLAGASGGPLRMDLPEKRYIVDYYDPKVGQWIDTRLIEGRKGVEIFVHKHYDELVILVQDRKKREATVGAKFPD